jgi:hypothetical protein
MKLPVFNQFSGKYQVEEVGVLPEWEYDNVMIAKRFEITFGAVLKEVRGSLNIFAIYLKEPLLYFGQICSVKKGMETIEFLTSNGVILDISRSPIVYEFSDSNSPLTLNVVRIVRDYREGYIHAAQEQVRNYLKCIENFNFINETEVVESEL